MFENVQTSAPVERDCSIGAFRFLELEPKTHPDSGFQAAFPSLSQFSLAEERSHMVRFTKSQALSPNSTTSAVSKRQTSSATSIFVRINEREFH